MAGKYAKKQKRPWIAAVLPWKGDRAGEAIRKIVFLVAGNGHSARYGR